MSQRHVFTNEKISSFWSTMGGLLSSFKKPQAVLIEESKWAKPHSLIYNQKLRDEQLKLLPNFKRNLKTCFVLRKSYGVEYQHWYITDGQWVLELAGQDPEDFHLMVHCNLKKGGTIDDTFILDDEVFERMESVCGMTNYSLALRNCEHVARYIKSGIWMCFQMLGSGALRNTFFSYMASHTRQINVLPKELETELPPLVKMYPDMPIDRQLVCFEKSEVSLTEADNEAYNVLFLGPTGSGKSTLINNFLNETACLTGANAESVTREVRFYQSKAQLETIEDGVFHRKLNVIDTLGFCDSKMTSTQVLEAIKSSVKVNLAYLDKVVIVCSGRIERQHQEAIKQFMDWLDFDNYHDKFIFIYNKSDGLSEAEKLKNLAYMCNQFGADTTASIEWVTRRKRQRIDMNIALGFPPNATFKEVKKDHLKLTDAVLECSTINRRLAVDKSSCTIL